jgi:hypothetical protein
MQRARAELLRAIENESAKPEINLVQIVRPSPENHSVRRAGVRHRRRFAVAATVAAGLIVAVGLVLPPPGKPSSAAAALDKVAVTAAQQPPQTPGPGQYYFIQEKVSIIETAHNPADDSTAEATFVGTENSWVSPNGSGETTQSWQEPVFSSLSEEAAWNAMPGATYDLRPLNGGVGIFYPGQLSGPASMDEMGFLDVAGLPTQETPLSQQIDDGTTGIHSVDTVSAGANTDFERVALLLAGPDIGATPEFTSALYEVLSTLPGVSLLGPTTSESGQPGLGFEAPDTTGEPITIIVNPSSGAFIELRYNDNNGPSPNGTYGGGSRSLAVTTSTAWVESLQSTIAPSSSLPPVSGCPVPVSLTTCPSMAAAMAAAAANGAAAAIQYARSKAPRAQ